MKCLKYSFRDEGNLIINGGSRNAMVGQRKKGENQEWNLHEGDFGVFVPLWWPLFVHVYREVNQEADIMAK